MASFVAMKYHFDGWWGAAKKVALADAIDPPPNSLASYKQSAADPKSGMNVGYVQLFLDGRRFAQEESVSDADCAGSYEMNRYQQTYNPTEQPLVIVHGAHPMLIIGPKWVIRGEPKAECKTEEVETKKAGDESTV